VPQGEAQARRPYRAGLADPLGLVSLPQRGARGAFGEEQVGIVVTADGVATLLCG